MSRINASQMASLDIPELPAYPSIAICIPEACITEVLSITERVRPVLRITDMNFRLLSGDQLPALAESVFAQFNFRHRAYI